MTNNILDRAESIYRSDLTHDEWYDLSRDMWLDLIAEIKRLQNDLVGTRKIADCALLLMHDEIKSYAKLAEYHQRVDNIIMDAYTEAHNQSKRLETAYVDMVFQATGDEGEARESLEKIKRGEEYDRL